MPGFGGATRKSPVPHSDSWPGSSPPGTGSLSESLASSREDVDDDSQQERSELAGIDPERDGANLRTCEVTRGAAHNGSRYQPTLPRGAAAQPPHHHRLLAFLNGKICSDRW